MTDEADPIFAGQFLKKLNSSGQCSRRVGTGLEQQDWNRAEEGGENQITYSTVDHGKECRFYSYKRKAWKSF